MTEEKKAVSIIIPTFNRAAMVVKAIESVMAQKSTDWEVIVVDDGSFDGTAERIANFSGDRVRYFAQANQGANVARNLGVSHARFDYVTFLDSDDELLPDWLVKFGECMVSRPTIICCGTLRVDSVKETAVLPKSLGPIFNGAFGKFTNGACYAIKKDVFVSVGGFDANLKSGQHTELSLRLADGLNSGKYTIVNIPEPLVKINLHDGPRIRTNSDSKYRGAYHTLRKHGRMMSADPVMKRNYAKIVTLQAYRRRDFSVAISTFLMFCKYAIIAGLKVKR